MTFAAEVKKECTLLEVHKEHAKAELAALIRMNGAVSLYQQRFILNVQSENAAIARRIYTLMKDHYQTEGELIVRRKMKLKKSNVQYKRCSFSASFSFSQGDQFLFYIHFLLTRKSGAQSQRFLSGH